MNTAPVCVTGVFFKIMTIRNTLIFAAFTLPFALIGVQRNTIKELRGLLDAEPIHDTILVETDWSVMVRALAEVESHGNAMAVNETSGAAGILQLMPIYVREANRIIGEDRFTYDDRFDVAKTLEMFDIVQSHHNRDRDIAKAIRSHNPKAGKWYDERVKGCMDR